MVEKIREPYQRHARNISTVSDISTTGSTGYSLSQALILRSIFTQNMTKDCSFNNEFSTSCVHQTVLNHSIRFWVFLSKIVQYDL